MRNGALLWLIGCLTLTVALIAAHPAAGAEPPLPWYSYDQNQQIQVNLYVFWSNGCPHCAKARAFIGPLAKRHPWLNLYDYEITSSSANKNLYERMATHLNQRAGQVPAFFYCGRLHQGYDSDAQTGAAIEKQLVFCYNYVRKQVEQLKKDQAAPLEKVSLAPQSLLLSIAIVGAEPNVDAAASPRIPASPPMADEPLSGEIPKEMPPAEAGSPSLPPSPQGLPRIDVSELEIPDESEMEEVAPLHKNTVEVPFWGKANAENLSLPLLTVVVAGCDAFNPCAFFVLLSLLSLMVHARSRARMLLVGGTFVFFSGLLYFLFMAAWLNLFLVVGELRLLTLLAGAVALVVAAINIKDYFWFKQGVSLSIPQSAQPGLFRRMRGLLSAGSLISVLMGTVVLALAANAYELLCTSGFPMVFTRVLTLRELPTPTYYLYLVLYNLIYVVPLGAIVIGFTYTLGSRRLQEYEGRLLKLLSGMMMLVLGGILLVTPESLHGVGTAIVALLAAIGLTALIAGADRLRPHPMAHSQGARLNRAP